jgi:hypothetical protein
MYLAEHDMLIYKVVVQLIDMTIISSLLYHPLRRKALFGIEDDSIYFKMRTANNILSFNQVHLNESKEISQIPP